MRQKSAIFLYNAKMQLGIQAEALKLIFRRKGLRQAGAARDERRRRTNCGNDARLGDIPPGPTALGGARQELVDLLEGQQPERGAQGHHEKHSL